VTGPVWPLAINVSAHHSKISIANNYRAQRSSRCPRAIMLLAYQDCVHYSFLNEFCIPEIAYYTDGWTLRRGNVLLVVTKSLKYGVELTSCGRTCHINTNSASDDYWWLLVHDFVALCRRYRHGARSAYLYRHQDLQQQTASLTSFKFSRFS